MKQLIKVTTILVFAISLFAANSYASKQSDTSNLNDEAACTCTYKGKEYSTGSEVCMDGIQKECSTWGNDNCYWAEVGECE